MEQIESVNRFVDREGKKLLKELARERDSPSRVVLERRIMLFMRPADEEEIASGLSELERHNISLTEQALKNLPASADISDSGHAGGILQLSGTLRQVFVELGPWSISDLALAVQLVARMKQASSTVRDRGGAPPGEIIEDTTLLRMLERDCRIARVSYQHTLLALGEGLAGMKIDIIDHSLISMTARPAFFIALDHEARKVLLVLRGTSNMKDVLTDALATKCAFQGGYAHQGFVLAAQWLEHNIKDKLLLLLKRHHGFQLKCIGHSLGGGVATVFAMMVKSEFPGISVVTFGTPATLSLELAESCKSFVRTVVFRDDVVPRFNTSNMDELRSQVISHDYNKDALPSAKKQSILNSVAGSVKRGVTSSADYARAVSGKYAIASSVQSASKEGLKKASGLIQQTHAYFTNIKWFTRANPRGFAVGDGSAAAQAAGTFDSAIYAAAPDHPAGKDHHGSSGHTFKPWKWFGHGHQSHSHNSSGSHPEASSAAANADAAITAATSRLSVDGGVPAEDPHDIELELPNPDEAGVAEEPANLRKIKLYPPGIIYHISVSAGEMCICHAVPASDFAALVISKTMIDDHRLGAIQRGIENCIDGVQNSSNVTPLLASSDVIAALESSNPGPGAGPYGPSPYPPPRNLQVQ